MKARPDGLQLRDQAYPLSGLSALAPPGGVAPGGLGGGSGRRGLTALRTGQAALASTTGYTFLSVAVGKSRLESYALRESTANSCTISVVDKESGVGTITGREIAQLEAGKKLVPNIAGHVGNLPFDVQARTLQSMRVHMFAGLGGKRDDSMQHKRGQASGKSGCWIVQARTIRPA